MEKNTSFRKTSRIDFCFIRIFSLGGSVMSQIKLDVKKQHDENIQFDDFCQSYLGGFEDSIGGDSNVLLANSLDRLAIALEKNGQDIEAVQLVNEAFFLGFFLVIFCGLLALPIVTFIRVLKG